MRYGSRTVKSSSDSMCLNIFPRSYTGSMSGENSFVVAVST